MSVRPEKRVATGHAVLPVFVERWSPRSFAARTPDAETLRRAFEAARLAPSAHNSQPTRFLVTRKGIGDGWTRLFACLSDGNRTWAHAAPVLVLAAGTRQRLSQVTGQLVAYPHFMHDVGLAVMSLILQAHASGLACHPMAGFDEDAARAAFDVPAAFEPVVVVAMGYLGPSAALADPALRAREEAPRMRRRLDELVFEGTWGRAASLFADVEPSTVGADAEPPAVAAAAARAPVTP